MRGPADVAGGAGPYPFGGVLDILRGNGEFH